MAIVGSWIPTGNDQQRLQGQLRNSISQLAATAAGLANLKNIMAQMAPGTDYTTIETYFGLQAGEGQTLHDVLGTASSALQGGDVQALLQRFG